MPTDTADKIDFDRMETILRLVYATAWKLSGDRNPTLARRSPLRIIR
jgi:hypothetical protein